MIRIVNNKIAKKGIIILILIIMILNTIVPIKVFASSYIDPTIRLEGKYEENPGGLPYAVYTPSSLNAGESIPLLVWLHGQGQYRNGAADLGIKPCGQSAFLRYPGLRAEKFVGFKGYILAPQLSGMGNRGNWNNTVVKNELEQLINQFLSNHNVDESNIFIGGYSLGGTGAVYMAQNIKNRFSKALVLSGVAGNNLEQITIPVKGYYGGRNDVGAPFMKEIGEKVPNSEIIKLENTDHPMVPDNTIAIDENNNNVPDIFEWLLDGKSGDTGNKGTVFEDGITFSRKYVNDKGAMPYYEYIPSSAARSDSVPMLVWLHGSGELRRRSF